jgi:hypothetical protein
MIRKRKEKKDYLALKKMLKKLIDIIYFNKIIIYILIIIINFWFIVRYNSF